MLPKILLMLCLLSVPLVAADEFTLYELQQPETHQFAITYDVTATREGAQFFFNPIRPGSVATKERVIERSSGKELKFETVNGKDAKATGLVPPDTSDKAEFIKVHLPGPVPKGGETRIRIFKTYTDAPSYSLTEANWFLRDRSASSATWWCCPKAGSWWSARRRELFRPMRMDESKSAFLMIVMISFR